MRSIAGAAESVFVDACLIDGISDEPVDRGFVRVREGRIAASGPMSAYRKAGGNERVVDLGGHTLLPGLIDCHVHFVYSGFRSLEEIDRCPIETAAINAIVNGGLMLDAGYTTVRDVGTIGNVAVAVRDAIAAGKVRGPRVIASGQIIGPTSGHDRYAAQPLEHVERAWGLRRRARGDRQGGPPADQERRRQHQARGERRRGGPLRLYAG